MCDVDGTTGIFDRSLLDRRLLQQEPGAKEGEECFAKFLSSLYPMLCCLCC